MVQGLPLILGAQEVTIVRGVQFFTFSTMAKDSSLNFLCLSSELVDHQLPGINSSY